MDFFFAQLIALITFFAFPAIQYVILKITAKKYAKPELWYLPDFGFRLVIRNIPNKKTLSNIKYRCLIRKIILPSAGASVSTYQDLEVLTKEDFFLFPNNDQVLISFQLKMENDSLKFVHTDKIANEIRSYEVKDKELIISDYIANIENWFNFDIVVGKRIEISFNQLVENFNNVQMNNKEQQCKISRILNVG